MCIGCTVLDLINFKGISNLACIHFVIATTICFLLSVALGTEHLWDAFPLRSPNKARGDDIHMDRSTNSTEHRQETHDTCRRASHLSYKSKDAEMSELLDKKNLKWSETSMCRSAQDLNSIFRNTYEKSSNMIDKFIREIDTRNKRQRMKISKRGLEKWLSSREPRFVSQHPHDDS